MGLSVKEAILVATGLTGVNGVTTLAVGNREDIMSIPVIGYIRVSTDKQEAEGISLEAQRSKIAAYCSLYDYRLIGIHEDVGSGKTMQRAGLEAALKDLCSRRAKGLIIVKLDRLTRNVADLSSLIDGWFSPKAKCEADLISITEHIDTTTASGRMVINMMGVISQWEREQTAERTTDALAYKRNNGKVYGPTPFGYDRDDDDLVANEYEQELIDWMLERRADTPQWGWKRIARSLNDQDIPSKQGGKWHANTVRGVVTRWQDRR
jgi:site-specific DNA recombinase